MDVFLYFSLQISKSKEQLSAGNEQRAEVMEQQERSATLEAELKKMRRKVQTNTKVIESQEQAQKGMDRSIGTFSKFGLKKTLPSDNKSWQKIQ